jgi:hypothetical protein
MNTATKTKEKQALDMFFMPAQNTKPYFKAALEGFAGSGKTYTAALIAIGIHKRIKSEKPIVMFDTEKAAKFLKPLFAEAGIELLVRESKSFADLAQAMAKMREGVSDVLIIDSITHVWEEFLRAYQIKSGHRRLQFQDWGIIKPTWKAEFSDPFVNYPYHIIMCGRAGFEYENEIDPETKKREIYKSGIKMKVEGETAYEPDILILMERYEKVLGDDKQIWREATVVKDRSTLIDGKTFKNPKYEDFAPCIEAMMSNPFNKKVKLVPEADTGVLFKTEEERAEFRKERDKWLEEIDGVLARAFPGSVGKDKQSKLDILSFVFGTTSETALRELHPEKLTKGYLEILDYLVDQGYAEYFERDGKKRLAFKNPQQLKAEAK